MSRQFTWDPHKATLNIQKHGVSFYEATNVFGDTTAVIIDDDEHSEYEHREFIIGHSHQNRLLIVSFTERGNVIRIITARKANQRESDTYEKAKR